MTKGAFPHFAPRLVARACYDLVRHCARELKHDSADQMAAALTYRTIFSLIPMLVLGVVAFKSVGGFEKAGTQVQGKIFDYLGLSNISYEDKVKGAATAPAPSVDTEGKAELREGIKKRLSELTDKAAGVSFAGIGAVGLILLIWAALGLAVSLEGSFNRIYNAPRGRPWHLRVAIYWAAITLGPVLLFVSLYLADKLKWSIEKLSVVPSIRPDGSWSRPEVVVYLGIILTSALKLLSHFTALLASWLCSVENPPNNNRIMIL